MSPKNDSTQPETPKPLQETQTQDHAEVPLRSVDRPVVPLTDAEAHYNSLVGYLKYLVTITMAAIALAVSVFFFATFKDRAAMRAEMRQDLGDIRSEIRQSATDMKSDAKSTIDNTKEQASAAINYTKDAAGNQISQIREQSGAIALTEAQKRVDNAFRTTNVETLVENAAKREVGLAVERRVQTEVDKVMASVQQDISTLGRIADAGSRMRQGIRSGYDELISLQENSQNETVRDRAKLMLESIASDYERIYLQELKEIAPNDAFTQLTDGQKLRAASNRVNTLVNLIRKSGDLREVTFAFLALRQATGYPFKMFDVRSVERWCSEHKSQCAR